MTPLKFYGKKSCVTCQKAKAFLEKAQVDFEELPIETQPPKPQVLEQLIKISGLKNSLNSRSTIYKANNLGKSQPDTQTVIQLMIQDPNLIKRPVIIDSKGNLYQGFDEASLKLFLEC